MWRGLLENKCLWLKYPLWFRKKPQDLNSHPQVAIQAHKKQCNAITESWISGVPNSTRMSLELELVPPVARQYAETAFEFFHGWGLRTLRPRYLEAFL